MNVKTNRNVALPTLVGLCITLAASTAQAQITRVGPVNPANGFPRWYQDSNGMTLELCLDPLVACNVRLPNPGAPLAFPGNFPESTSYWQARAEMRTNGGGVAELVLGLEAAFLNTTAVDGEQMVFGRIRFRIDNLDRGATYTATTPFGTFVFENVGGGNRGVDVTQDIGRFPGDFTAALSSNVGPFLVWDPAESPPPAGFVGDPNVDHTVIGSPIGINFFRLEGPNVGGDGVNLIETDRFFVIGKIIDPCNPVISDLDADTIGDACDNCPSTPNTDQADFDHDGIGDVCDPDSDGDGMPNATDGCPADPFKVAAGACGCGLPETDTDADGTPDCVDNCPADAAKTDPGICGCATPDTDTDADGTPDCADNCPADAAKIDPGVCGCGTPDIDADNDGVMDCVAAPAPIGGDGAGDGGAGGGGLGDSQLAFDNCPTALTVQAQSPVGFQLDFQLPAAGGGIGDVAVSVDPPLGTMLPVGVTTVTVIASDQAAKSITCTFDITVLLAGTGGDSPSAPVCGNGLCGLGGAAMMPFMLLGWGLIKTRSRTRRAR